MAAIWRFKVIKCQRFVVLGCLLVWLPMVSAQAPTDLGVLKVVPAEAWGVLTVRSLTEVDQKLGSLSQQLMLPIPPSPLAMAKGYLGLLNGLDDAREAALVFMPSENLESPGDSMVIFLPCKDYKQLLTFLEPAEVAPGISKIKLGTDEGFMTEKDGYAVTAPTQALLERTIRSGRSLREQLTDEERAPFSAEDIMLWANVEAFASSSAFPQFRDLLAGMQGDPERVKDLKTVGLSLQLATEGLHFKLFVQAKPGTEAARLAEAVKPAEGSLLGGLPAQRLIFAYGTTASAQSGGLVAENTKRMLNRVPAERRQRLLSDAKMESLRQFIDGTLTQLRGMNMAINSVEEADHGRIMVTAAFRSDGQAPRLREQLADFINRMKADEPAAAGAASPAEESGAMMKHVEYASQASTVAGASVDEIRLNPPASDEDRPVLDWLHAFFGKGTLAVRVAAVDDNVLVMAIGGAPSDFEAAISAVRSNDNALASMPMIADAGARLPALRSSEGYLKIDEFLRSLAATSKDMDEPWLMDEIPQVDAVAAFATTNFGAAGSRTELVLPTEVLISIKDMASQRRATRTAPVN